MAERYNVRLDSWMSESDAAFVAAVAEAEASSTSAVIRRMVRTWRASIPHHQQQHQPAE
jgi:hypothetical protein